MVESIPDHLATDEEDATGTKKPRKTQSVAGFLGVGGREFESPTSTMSTSEHGNENSLNCSVKPEVCERLHQCLHQIVGNNERTVASVLLDVIAETLGNDATGRILDALEREAEAAVSSHDGGTKP